MIKDFVELVVSAAEISGDQNAANYATMLVGIAESKLSRKLKVRQAMQTVSVTTNGEGYCGLPRGYIDMVHAFVETPQGRHRQLPSGPLALVRQRSAVAYALHGDRILSYYERCPHEFTYYQELPSLSEEGCNWLLESAPDIYLQALLLEISVKNRDINVAIETQAYLDRLIADFVRSNRVAATAKAVPGGLRP